MKSIINGLLIFASGSLVGVLVTRFVMLKKYLKLEEEYFDLENDYMNLNEDYNGLENALEKKQKLDDFPWGRKADINKNTELVENYQTAEKPSEDEMEISTPEETLCSAPYIITGDQFVEELDDYDKITISYYEVDESLVDEGNQLIDDIIGTIGTALEDSDDSVIYVRNELFGIDYEIIRIDAAFLEEEEEIEKE